MSSRNPLLDQPLGDRTREKTIRNTEHLERIAHLVGTGELPFPTDLPTDQIERLVALVRERRRRKLVQFLARAIAKNICGGEGDGSQER